MQGQLRKSKGVQDLICLQAESAASHHQSGVLIDDLRVQALVQLPHDCKEACCEQDIEATKHSSAAELLRMPIRGVKRPLAELLRSSCNPPECPHHQAFVGEHGV